MKLSVLHSQQEMSPSHGAHHHGIGPAASFDSVMSICVLQRHQGKDSPHFQKTEEASLFTKDALHAPHVLPARSDRLYPAGSLLQPLNTGEIGCGQRGEGLLQLP